MHPRLFISDILKIGKQKKGLKLWERGNFHRHYILQYDVRPRETGKRKMGLEEKLALEMVREKVHRKIKRKHRKI